MTKIMIKIQKMKNNHNEIKAKQKKHYHDMKTKQKKRHHETSKTNKLREHEQIMMQFQVNREELKTRHEKTMT